MLNLLPQVDASRPLKLLCLGAHSDDIEIGCGGTVLSWLESARPIDVTWVVFTAEGIRASETRRSAAALLRRAARTDVVLGRFRDGFLPSQYEEVKAFMESVKANCTPDIVLTHRLEDRHQDHRLVSELTWNTWRNQLVLEYEIMKYEGDLGQPNVFVPLRAAIARRKGEHLMRHFGTQRSKDWFNTENFLGLARIRGLECRAAEGYAEAFHVRKAVVSARLD
jgi:LmbE family N-acetylglucosaminyl deacetylase